MEQDEDTFLGYLEGREPTVDKLKQCIRKGTLSMTFTPVLTGSAFKNKGVQTLLDAVVDYLPSPLDRPAVSGVDVADCSILMQRLSSDVEPLSCLAFKIMSDPFVGQLTFIRVYSGVIQAGGQIRNSVRGKMEKVGRMLQMHANDRTDVKEARAGDIVAVAGLKDTVTGDTLCDAAFPIILEKMDFPESVIKISVEPKTKADQVSTILFVVFFSFIQC